MWFDRAPVSALRRDEVELAATAMAFLNRLAQFGNGRFQPLLFSIDQLIWGWRG
jgi:hypothetical protein